MGSQRVKFHLTFLSSLFWKNPSLITHLAPLETKSLPLGYLVPIFPRESSFYLFPSLSSIKDFKLFEGKEWILILPIPPEFNTGSDPSRAEAQEMTVQGQKYPHWHTSWGKDSQTGERGCLSFLHLLPTDRNTRFNSWQRTCSSKRAEAIFPVLLPQFPEPEGLQLCAGSVNANIIGMLGGTLSSAGFTN